MQNHKLDRKHTWSLGLAVLMTAVAALIAAWSRLLGPNGSLIDCDLSIMITRSLGVDTAKLYHGLQHEFRNNVNCQTQTFDVCFSVRVVQLWNKLPEEVVSASGVRAFISRLNSIYVSFFNVLF